MILVVYLLGFFIGLVLGLKLQELIFLRILNNIKNKIEEDSNE